MENQKLHQLAQTIKTKILNDYKDLKLVAKIDDMLPKVDWDEIRSNFNLQTTNCAELENEIKKEDELIVKFTTALESGANFNAFIYNLQNELEIIKKEIFDKVRKLDLQQAKELLNKLS